MLFRFGKNDKEVPLVIIEFVKDKLCPDDKYETSNSSLLTPPVHAIHSKFSFKNGLVGNVKKFELTAVKVTQKYCISVLGKIVLLSYI